MVTQKGFPRPPGMGPGPGRSGPPAPAHPVAKVSPHGRWVRAQGHPWVVGQHVGQGPDPDAASGGPAVVLVQDQRGRAGAEATWAARSPVALRILTRFGMTEPTPVGRPLPDLLEIVDARL